MHTGRAPTQMTPRLGPSWAVYLNMKVFFYRALHAEEFPRVLFSDD
jgi:hypothetical protein